MTAPVDVVAESYGAPTTAPARPRFSSGQVSGFAQRYALVGLLALLTVLCLVALPEFRSADFIKTMINTQSIILLLALAATVVLRTGDFDLSISQMMICSAAIVAVFSREGISPGIAIASAVLLGLAVGAINGTLVVLVGVDSFVTTLGSFTALGGFAYLITDSRIVTAVPDTFVNLSRSQIAGIPTITWYAWILVGVLWYVYQRTPLGRYMNFIGGNRSAAQLAGLRVKAIRFGAYLVSGVLAALIGVLFAGYFGAIDPSVGGQYMLQPFAAVFLGATAIAVGRFNAIGTVVALYLLTVGITGLQLMGAQTWVTNVFYGIALMVAITAAKLAGRSSGTAS